MTQSEENWRPKVLIITTVVGALTGLAAGYLLSRTAEESGGAAPRVKTTDMIRIVISTIGLVRGIAALGDGK